MGQRKAMVVLWLVSAGLAQAQGAPGGLHPMPRPPELSGLTATVAALPLIRPPPRPEFAAAQPQVAPLPEVTPVALPPAAQSPAPPTLKGALCQRADIKGKALAPINSKVKGCNVAEPVLVTQVAGVTLSPPATINCEEATALSNWITKGLQPAFQNQIVALNVADSYSCRSRNNVRGAQTSVHGLGQAIDIASFVTKSGRTYTVASNYGAQIRAAQKAGCGTFHTILGPGSDGYHENHIHFDVSHHGGRDYCH